MSFIQIFRIFWAQRYLIVVAMFACLLAAAIAVKSMPKLFESHARVMLDIIKPDPVTGQTLPTNFARAYTATQTELITDDRVAIQAAENLGWFKNATLQKAYRDNVPSGRPSYREWLIGIIRENTKVDSVEASNIIDISYRSTSPEVSRRMADALRRAYQEQSIVFQAESALRNARWFEQQAAKTRDELTAAEREKTAYERRNNVVLTDDYADTATTRLRSLASQAPGTAINVGGAIAPSPAAAQLAQVDGQIAAASKMLGPNHPEIEALRQQRSALAATAAQERAAAIAAAAASSGSGPSITSQVADQQSRVLAQRDQIAELRKMQARIEVLRDQYQKTMARAGELTLEANSRDSGVTPLGAATTPEAPVSPKTPLILGGALALGAALGIGIAVLLELLNRRVRGPEDLRDLDAPLIGAMPSRPDPLSAWFNRRVRRTPDHV